MGKNQSKESNISQKIEQQVVRQLTPIQRWNSSQQTHEDLMILLQTSLTLNQWSNAIHHFIKTISNREKYQHYLIVVLDFLRSQGCKGKFNENDRKELFTLYSNKLKNSFFVSQDFQENLMNYNKRPKEKLYILYQYYSQSEQNLQKAIFFNYPTIFLQFRLFFSDLIQSEVLISNQQQLCRLIIPLKKIEEIKQYFQIVTQSYVMNEQQKLLQEVRLVQNMKGIYLQCVQELLNYDYADLSSNIYRNIIAKGYQLDTNQYQLFLKVQLYSLFLYQLNRLSLQFSQIRSMTIPQIIHYFYTNYDIQETPTLVKCFQIFDKPTQKWQNYIFAYIFSQLSHISIMIRLIQKKYISFEGKNNQFVDVVQKVKKSNCQSGRYCQQLINLALCFDIDFGIKTKYLKLIKLIEIYYLFNISSTVQFLYGLTFVDWDHLDKNQLLQIEENGLILLRKIITNYFKEFSVKTKTIQIQQQQFKFSTVFEILNFIQFIKKYFLNSYINNCITHQIFFKQLINNQRYIEIKALMSEQRLQQFDINSQTIEMIIGDHIITLLTTKKVRKIDQSLKLLLSIMYLYPITPYNNSHYLVSSYHYIKYLQEKDIVLPYQMKENISIQNLYFIVNHYHNKIENIDFNYLFTLQSSIKMQYTDHAAFIPIITDQFLKFKIFLCNKAYSTKKYKLGAQIIQQVIKYQPPWISTELVNILKQNNNIQSNFIAIAFDFCARGEDLQLILDLYSSKDKGKSSKLSLLNLKTWKNLLEQDKYLVLTDQLVINESLYKNHVAQLCFSQDETLKTTHYLFFHMLTIQPQRSFNYAINYNMPASFILNFILEAAKKGIINMRNIINHLLRYLYFLDKKTRDQFGYISKKQYSSKSIDQIIKLYQFRGDSYASLNLEKMIRSYNIQKIVTQQFLQMYLNKNILFQFLYEQNTRKKILVDLRQQPMSKSNAKVLKMLCEKASIDIIELSIYNLVSQVNSKEVINSECWTIAQKLIFWGEDRNSAFSIVNKLSQKIQILSILVSIIDYLRESELNFREIVSDYHLQIIKSLAAVQSDKNLYGIIPENFFERSIGVYPLKNRGMLSDTHRRILKESACMENIFVVSKALYFMYGCNDEIEKIVLGEFSLQQQDCEEFELLRKKIKAEAEGY